MMTWLHLDKSCLWTHKIFCKASTRTLITEQEASKSPLSKKCITNTTIDNFLLYYLYTSTDHFRPLDNWRTVARAAWYKLLAPATDPSSLSAPGTVAQSPLQQSINITDLAAWLAAAAGACNHWSPSTLLLLTVYSYKPRIPISAF